MTKQMYAGSANTRQSEDEGASAQPPNWVVFVMYVGLAACVLLFLPARSETNWSGYAMGAWAVAILGLVYRGLDRRARTKNPSTYRSDHRLDLAVMYGVGAGWALAAVHAYFLATESTLAT